MDKRGIGSSCVVFVLVAAGAVAACGGGGGSHATTPAQAAARGQTSCKFTSTAKPIGRTGSSATIALAHVGDKRVAFVADEDAKAILTVDLETRTQIAEAPLDGTPAQVYVTSDGRVFATLRDKAEIAGFEVTRADASLTKRCQATTPTEPLAIAATADDATLVVTSGWGQKLAAFDTMTLASKLETKLPREPRSVVLSDDGKTAFVSHAVGSQMSTVDLAGPKHEVKSVSLSGAQPGEARAIAQRKAFALKMAKKDPTTSKMILDEIETEAAKAKKGRPSCQGFALTKSASVAGRIFAPQVMVDPGDPDARPDGYGDENQETETPNVAIVDEGTSEAMPASLTIGRDMNFMRRGNDQRDPHPQCLLPRAAAIDPSTKSLLVTCYGIDAVIAYDAQSATPLSAERRRWTVGSGPSGIAVDTEKHRAVVWSQFDRTIATLNIGGTELSDEKVAPPLVQRTAMNPLKEKLPAEYALGRILFHAAGDTRISSDGRACASCHPDGRDDAITWATPEGPRRSIMLAGRVAKTGPYSWNGNENSIPNHLGNTFDRLSGKGLRSIELDALVAYLTNMPAPPQTPDGGDKAKIDRGRAIFSSAEAQCASCHSGATFTDGQNHDVQSKHKADRETKFNTPSLHLVGGTGPYFHDGRYATLEELLKKSDGMMGKTKQLDDKDIDALASYLRSL